MRVYLPATIPLLREWVSLGSATASGPAFAVTPSLREWYREGDLEELEHAASLLAAVASIELIAADASAEARRVVLAVDVDEAVVSPDLEQRGALRLAGPLPRAQWASALIDDPGAAGVVEAAVALLRSPAVEPDDLDFAFGEAEAADLAWYAVQELSYLL